MVENMMIIAEKATNKRFEYLEDLHKRHFNFLQSQIEKLTKQVDELEEKIKKNEAEHLRILKELKEKSV